MEYNPRDHYLPDTSPSRNSGNGRLWPRPCLHLVLVVGFAFLASGIALTVVAGHPGIMSPSTDGNTMRVFGYAFICAGGVVMIKAIVLFALDRRALLRSSSIDDVIPAQSDLGTNCSMSAPPFGAGQGRFSPWSRVNSYHLYYPDVNSSSVVNAGRFQSCAGQDFDGSGLPCRYWDPPPPYPGKSTLT